MSRFEVLAVNDAASFCECCGRSGLQRVVWVADHETGEHKHFGTSCALTPAKGFDCVEDIKAAIKSHANRVKYAISAAHRAYKIAGGKHVAAIDAKGEQVWNVADTALWEQVKAQALAA